jgi:hypothetical protein
VKKKRRKEKETEKQKKIKSPEKKTVRAAGEAGDDWFVGPCGWSCWAGIQIHLHLAFASASLSVFTDSHLRPCFFPSPPTPFEPATFYNPLVLYRLPPFSS